MTANRNEPTTIFRRLAARMAASRQARLLSALDDHLLVDIGLTRPEIFEMHQRRP